MVLLESLESTVASHVPAGAKVYKDDCMYSFDDAENNPNGLDVCLNCYQSYSRSDVNYTKQHWIDTGHKLYLNIRQTLKPESERDFFRRNEEGESSPKIAKLEIKDTAPADIYNFAYGIYCIEDDTYVKLADAPEKFQRLAKSIIDFNSSNREEEIKAWEQEITACEHSIEIEQFENTQINLSHCSQCELKENLWICLHCGALGCGRQQYGSNTPGNSHALKHFEDTEHPVAIKLGSLSATDKDAYDAYCYKCNDEVKVPDLVRNLQNYGIDLDKTVKTEKSLIELNLDQNKNWDFGLGSENGDKLQPVFGQNLTGLSNLGNSCYLSSVVQSLFHLNPYLTYFADKEFPTYDKLANPANDLFSQLLKLYHGLVSGKFSKPNALKGDDFQLGLKLVMLKSLIGKDHAEFKTNKQQDAFEFLLYFLDQLDKQLGIKLNESFKFLLTNRILCSSCMKGKAQDELVDSIALSIEDEVVSVDEDGKKIYKEVTLLDSFRTYCEDEVIEGYKCDNCNQKTEGIRSCAFKSFPDYLIVNAKRIKLENWVPIKIDVPITIPDTLDINDFMTETSDLYEYPSTDNDDKFAPNEDSLNMLLGMGFPENRATKALYRTGNGDAETAMNWLFEHMEDADIDEPLVEDKSSNPQDVDQEAVDNLVSMGFAPELSRKALLLNGDPNAAVEWLFNNPDDDGKLEKEAPPLDIKAQEKELIAKLNQSANKGNYKLKAVVCHKGSSPHTGHYVTFIRIEDQWVLFNDEKVLKCQNDNLKDIMVNGYVYFFERCG